MWDRIKGWRTVVFNAAHAIPAAALALLLALSADTSDLSNVLGAILTPARALLIMSVIGLINVLLRVFCTTGPVGTKE